MRYFAEVSYVGTHFHGWQRQKNTTVTVQGKIEEAFTLITGQSMEITGSGRTDAGVHCLSQWFHFEAQDRDLDLQKLQHRLNRLLPDTIAILQIKPVVPDAHARFSAIHREYIYKAHLGKKVFLNGQSLQLRTEPDLNLLNEAAAYLIGQKDFENFSKTKTDVANHYCTIERCSWAVQEDRFTFQIRANRFLRGMVRIVVGNLLMVGNRKRSLHEFGALLNPSPISADLLKRNLAPSEGLYLNTVQYPEELFKN